MIGHHARRARAARNTEAVLGFEGFLREQEERVRTVLQHVEDRRRERLEDPWLGIRECDSLEVRR